MERPNILFVLIDSTIPEGYSSYGADADVTPNISKLAENGMVFDNIYANAGWTPPSHASFFTGKLPSRTNSLSPEPVLDEDETLASKLSEKGYETYGIITSAHITPEAGYDTGFDEYIITYKDFSRYSLNPQMMVDTLKNRIWGRRNRTYFTTRLVEDKIENSSEPWFLFTNYATAHRPYRPSKLLKRKFSVNKGNTERMQDLMDRNIGGISDQFFEDYEMQQDDWELLKSWYKAELHRMDKKIGDMVEKLKDAGQFENTVIVIASDHGDEFGEHDLFGHGYLFDTNLKVPLIISGEDIPKGRTDKLTSLMDVMPTLLNIAGADVPEEIDAKPIFPLEEYDREYSLAENGTTNLDDEHTLGERLNHRSKSITDGQFKLIVREGSQNEIYNTEEDPDEQENIISKNKEKADQLKEELPNFEEETEGDKYTGQEDEKIKKRLEELGYK